MASLDLSELKTVENLEKKVKASAVANAPKYKYLYQHLVTKDLGISTPPRLKGLNTALGWGSAAVESLMERIFWRGYWSPENTASETTEWLNNLYRLNYMEMIQKGHQKDAFTTGHSYVSIGLGGDNEPEVLWRNESPNEMYGVFNSRKLILENALKVTKKDGYFEGTLFLPDSTIILRKDAKGDSEWLLHDRDDHELGFVSVVPIINSPDTKYPRGRTEITPALRGYVDSAMRTLLGAELAREFTAQPLRALLGADAADFIKEDGTPADAWDLIQGKIINVPYNAKDGILPQLLQMTPSDPSVIMNMIEPYGRLAAREIGVPPSDFGFETVNPSSADAMIEANRKVTNRAQTRIPALKMAYKQMAEYSLRMTGQSLPEDWGTLEAVFMRPETPTPQASADRVVKLASMGIFSQEFPTWVYREIGLSEVEIKETTEFLRKQGAQDLITNLIQANTSIGATPEGA